MSYNWWTSNNENKLIKIHLKQYFLLLIQIIHFINFCFDFHSFFWPYLTRQRYCVRFIKEYSSLRDFGSHVVGLFLYKDFWKMIFWLVFKLEISYKVVISWRIFGFFKGFCFKNIFCMVKYWNFHNFSFALW
jgi:hypothetical protein